MSAEIINWPGITCLDWPAQTMLDKAGAADLDHVVIIGFDKDGDFYFGSNKSDGADCLWLLELAKKKLLEIGDQ